MVIKITLFIVFSSLIFIFGGIAAFKTYQHCVDDDEHGVTVPVIFGVLAVAMLACTIFIPGNIHQVDTGEVAVVRHMGKIDGYREPGIHWDAYMTNSYEIYNTKIQTIEIDTQTYSKDNQIIGVTTTFQYTIQTDKIEYIAANIGSQAALEDRLKPIILDTTKTVFAQNTAETMIGDRAQLTADINTAVTAAVNVMTPYDTVKTVVDVDGVPTEQISYQYHPMVIVNNVLITNLDFTDDFEAAVAAKVAQEQKKQQALIEQEQQLAEAENNKKIAIANAEAAAESARLAAEAEAQVAKIKAEADKEVAMIAADSAEYQGKKDAAIKLQALASVNGWTVVSYTEADGTTYSKLMKSDGTVVNDTELQAGVQNLLKSEYYAKWDGKLPTYYMNSDGSVSTVLIPDGE